MCSMARDTWERMPSRSRPLSKIRRHTRYTIRGGYPPNPVWLRHDPDKINPARERQSLLSLLFVRGGEYIGKGSITCIRCPPDLFDTARGVAVAIEIRAIRAREEKVYVVASSIMGDSF